MNSMKYRGVSVTCCGLLGTILALTGCGSFSQQPSSNQNGTLSHTVGKIRVVAAEDFWGEAAKAVGGNNVQVVSILNAPNIDPHVYEPTPAASREVNDAQLVIYTGIGYDEWMSKLIQASTSSDQKMVINVGHNLLGKNPGDNPHVWYIPGTMPTLASTIANDLSKLDPVHTKEYHQRAEVYEATLTPLKKLVEKLRQPSPVKIDVSEPVFDYMAESLNMVPGDAKFAKAIEDGNEPTPTDVAQLQNDIQQRRIKLFIENIQTDDPTVQNMAKLASDNHIPVIQVTETEPSGHDYLSWMTGQLQQIKNALGTQPS